MPIDGSSAEILNNLSTSKKKRSNKKRRQNRKSQSKVRQNENNDGQNHSTNGLKNVLNPNRPDPVRLTADNLASLRWDNVLTDSKLESERIERYKELRRQRYNVARENALRIVLEQMKLTATANETSTLTAPLNSTENDQ